MSNDRFTITINKRPVRIGPLLIELLERQGQLEESPYVGTESFKEETAELASKASRIALDVLKSPLTKTKRAHVRMLLLAAEMARDELVTHGKQWRWIFRATRRHPATGQVLVASDYGLRGWRLLVPRR